MNTIGNKASNAPQGFKASHPLPQRPSIDRVIGRFSGSQPLLFHPGPQNYLSKKPAASVQDQNRNLKSLLLNTVSDFESSTANSASSAATATNTGVFERRQSEDYMVDDQAESNTKDTNTPKSSDSDSDGGVTLAMQAAFLQRPGITSLSLRPVASRPREEPQKQGSGVQEDTKKEHGLEQQGPVVTENVRRPSLRTQPPLSSHIAAILQTPGSARLISTRRKSAATTLTASPNCSSSTSSSAPTPAEPERNQDRTPDEPSGKRATSVKGPHNLPNFIFTSKNLIEDKVPGRFTDPDNDLYWNTPITQPVQLSKPPQKPLSKPLQSSTQLPLHKPLVSVSVTKQRDHSPSSLITPRRSRGLKDGDIVGGEAPEIPKENKGRRMMEKMGYKEGTPLGANGNGELEPVKVEIRVGNRGLGLSTKELENRAREEQAIREERARNIQKELLARVAQSEKITRMQRASLDAAFQNHVFNHNQTNQGIIGSFDQVEINQVSTRQPEGFIFPGAMQIERYTLTTPLEIHKIREKVSEIICELDAVGCLGPVDTTSILWSSINSAIALIQQSPFGFLVDAELIEIVRREYTGVIIKKGYAGTGW